MIPDELPQALLDALSIGWKAALVLAVFVIRNWHLIARRVGRDSNLYKGAEWFWRETEQWKEELCESQGGVKISGAQALEHFLDEIEEWWVAGGHSRLGPEEKAGLAKWAKARSRAAKVAFVPSPVPPTLPHRTPAQPIPRAVRTTKRPSRPLPPPLPPPAPDAPTLGSLPPTAPPGKDDDDA